MAKGEAVSTDGKGGGFRSDVQGLRALAVGLVMLGHAGITGFSGGFVGVDVFFVVSGFLIIGLLVREGQRDGRISIAGFYARRARRILPAATLVLVATVAVAAWRLPLVRVSDVLKDALWASGFLANFRFAAVETDYFAADDPPSPLQHYWSLAVEEQFYVVIPLLMLVAALLVSRGRAKAGVRADRGARLLTWSFGIVAIVTALSLVWSIYSTSVNVTAAYFSTAARAWELGLGGLVALLLLRPPARFVGGIRRWQAEVLNWTGLAMVAFAAFSFDEKTPFPGSAALVPVVGTAILLGVGGSSIGSRTLLYRALSLRPLTLMGAWSFSLYLWHWPILQFAHERWGRNLDTVHTGAAFAATFILSAATFYLVEEPFRRGVHWRPRLRAISLYPASLVLVLVAAFSAHTYVDAQLADLAKNPGIDIADYKDQGISKDPAVATVQASVLAAKAGRPIPGRLSPELGSAKESVAPLGDCDYREGMRRLCPTGDTEATRSIVVLGDSHGRAWGPTFTKMGEDLGYVVYHLVYSGCPPNKYSRLDPANGQEWSACLDFNAWALEQVADLKPALVVVANNAYRAAFGEAQGEGLAWELTQLRESADRVVLFGDLPILPRVPGVCLSTRDADLGTCLFEPKPYAHRRQKEFGEIAEGVGAEYVDAHRWFCAYGRCPSVIGRMIPMRDKDHITVEYAQQLADPVARRLGLVAEAG